MFKLLLPYEVPASVLDKYKDTFEFVGAVDGKEEISMDEAKELIRDCDAIFSMRVFPIPEELLACGEKLRVVTNHGVGYDHIDVAACSRRGILAINTPQAVCEPTAEFTMALLLGITKGITMFDRNLRRDRVCNIGVFFDRDILLYGKTVGIVGFGRIGQAVLNEQLHDGFTSVVCPLNHVYATGVQNSPRENQFCIWFWRHTSTFCAETYTFCSSSVIHNFITNNLQFQGICD